MSAQTKKISSHSARETVVKKLKSSGIPKCEIKNITGHSFEQGLDDYIYDSGDENEQRIMSNIIDNATNTTPTARQVLQLLSSVHHSQAGLPVKSTILAIVMSLSTSVEAILHNQVSARASGATIGSFFQILTLFKLYFVFCWQKRFIELIIINRMKPR